MYKCKHCGEEFEKPQEIGGHVLSKHKKEKIKLVWDEKKKQNEILYYQNPKKCIECNDIINYNLIRKDKRRKFCSHSCSAKNSNKKRGFLLKEKSKICLCCGKSFNGIRTKRNNLYCDQTCERKYKDFIYIKQWLENKKLPIKDGAKINLTIRKYILEEQKNKCEICGMEPVWNDKPISFIMDHIDGNSSDTSRENLRMICPNCDSQTDTYKGKNKGSGRHYRKERYQQGKSF